MSSTSILNQDLEGVTYLDTNVDVVNQRSGRKIITSNKLTKMDSGININIVDSPTSQDNQTIRRHPTLKSKEEILRILKKSWELAKQ